LTARPRSGQSGVSGRYRLPPHATTPGSPGTPPAGGRYPLAGGFTFRRHPWRP
jgi:hypothetical protein